MTRNQIAQTYNSRTSKSPYDPHARPRPHLAGTRRDGVRGLAAVQGAEGGGVINTDECHCRKCLTQSGAFTDPARFIGMIVCELCGNKRCPNATDHDFECTNSNEPGQPGSIYGLTPNPTKNMSEEKSTYVCPQCGPDPAGPTAHQVSHHMMPRPERSNLERPVDANTLAIHTLQDWQATDRKAIERLTTQLSHHQETIDRLVNLEASKLKADSAPRPSAMPDPLPGQTTISLGLEWLRAWNSAAASATGSRTKEQCAGWADACLQDFKARFRGKV